MNPRAPPRNGNRTPNHEPAMIQKTLLSISLIAIPLAMVLPCHAALPRAVAETIAPEDLVAEIETRLHAIEEAASSEANFAAARRSRLTADTALLSILAAALVESGAKADSKVAGRDLYDAALALQKSESHADAAKALAAAKAALAGTASGAKRDVDWNALSRSRNIMAEINARNDALRRARKKRPSDTAQSARDASVISLLALVMHEDNRKPDNPEYNAAWKKLALELRDQSHEAALAMKRGDWDAAGLSLNKANEACTRCHEELRRR